MKKLSIIVPAYNEEKRIGKMLEKFSDYFERVRKEGLIDYEIFVVINNTKDRTEDVVREASEKNKRIIYINIPDVGKGNAVIVGFKDALKRKNDLIGFVDADLATMPEDFFDLVRKIGNSDCAIASRYIKGAIIDPKPTVPRLIAKRMFNIWVRAWLMIPCRDTQCGAKIFKRRVLEKILPKLVMSQWAFDVDLLYNTIKEGFRIKDVPTRWADKEYATINFWSAGPGMALGVLRLRILNSPLRDLVRLYDKVFGKS